MNIALWSKPRKVAAAVTATVVGVGLCMLFYQRQQQQEQNTKKSQRKTKARSVKCQKKKSKPKITKQELFKIIRAILMMVSQALPRVLQMRESLQAQQVPEDEKNQILSKTFDNYLKKSAALVYENHGVAEADVLEAHAAYQHHAPIVEVSKQIQRLKDVLLPVPVPDSVTIEKAKEMMTALIEGQSKCHEAALNKAQKKLNVSRADIECIMQTPDHPKHEKIQEMLASADIESLKKKILAKHDLGTDTRIFSALTGKFAPDPSFVSHIQKLQQTLA